MVPLAALSLGRLMKASLERYLFPLAAIAPLVGQPQAHSDDLALTPGVLSTVRIPGAVNGNFTGFVADPAIADVYYGPKNVFMFVGKKIGTTSFIAIDNENGAELYRATLRVGVGTAVNVRIYSGVGKSDNYICGRSLCTPSEN
jgi:Flp pilus assembly secretin CpaC